MHTRRIRSRREKATSRCWFPKVIYYLTQIDMSATALESDLQSRTASAKSSIAQTTVRFLSRVNSQAECTSIACHRLTDGVPSTICLSCYLSYSPRAFVEQGLDNPVTHMGPNIKHEGSPPCLHNESNENPRLDLSASAIFHGPEQMPVYSALCYPEIPFCVMRECRVSHDLGGGTAQLPFSTE